MANKGEQIRKRVLGIYNKARPDFGSTPDWYDYQELVEDKIYNLVEGINVQETEEEIQQYQAENRSTILQIQARKAEAMRRSADVSGAADGVDLSQQSQVGGMPMPQSLPPPSHHEMTPEQQRAMAKASGYDAELCLRRNVEEAFASIFVAG